MKLRCDICLKLFDAKSLNYLTEEVDGKKISVKYCDDINCFKEAHRLCGYETF